MSTKTDGFRGGPGRAPSLRTLLAPVLALSLWGSLPCALAFAQGHDEGPVIVRGELGVAAMLPDYQRARLDYGAVFTGAVRPAVRIVGPLLVQLSAEGWLAPSELGYGDQWVFGGGVRVEPRVASDLWIWAGANAGLAITGGDLRFALGVGIGLEIGIEEIVSVGPYVRYSHTFAASEDYPSDAMMLGGGVSVTVRTLGEERAPPRSTDRDADGVADADDLCPDTPAGDEPDTARAGCPLADRDGDRVPDREDVCPDRASGPRPDPMRTGCPAIDTDDDGALDHDDACPTTPAGATPDPARAGCPDGDDDRDGVRNALDPCPGEHQGVHPDPARPGCPLPDGDNDSIPDGNDHCPTVPGAPHPDPARNGCPGLVRIEGRSIVILQPVFFATRRDRILHRSRPVLEAVADALRASPEIRRLSIEGHTDDVGEDEANLELSRRRANNVMAYLIQHGVEPSRLEAHGHGESRPLIEDTTEDARGVNRRVEFRVTERAGDPEEVENE
jgi:outer membrane protein OmpA-like peptidoglycan-associated protein